MTITNTVESAFATVRSAASDLHDMGSVAVDDVSGRCTEIADELESAVEGIDMEPEPGETCPVCGRVVVGEPRSGDAVALFVAKVSEFVSDRVLRDALRATVEAMQNGATRPPEGYAAEVAGTLKVLAEARP